MNLITLENISKSYSEKVLLNNINLSISEGDKIGLIGLNGAGKSTLLKILAGREEFFDGNIIKGKNVRIEYLAQNTEYSEDDTILEQIFKGDSREMKLLMEYEDLLEKIKENSYLSDKLIELQSQIDTMNLWDLESNAKTILTKLGIKDFNKKMGELSGGQRKRVFLASSLIAPCDLLVLDEPTNHLDSDSIEWLEEYLNNRKGSLIMITHDRYFLDRVTNRIIELDRGELHSYNGNYSKYLEKKAERLQIEASREEKRQKLILKELKWVRRGAKARTTKQKARLQRFEELVKEEYTEINTEIDIPFIGKRLGKKIIEINNISKKYEDNIIINDFSYIFTKEDRIGIVGPNGVGKTTLVNLITKLRVLMSSPNLLIFDEPTNDLDIETLKILEDFLDEYLGVVIIVSHDRYFLDRLCNKILAYEGKGCIREYVGNYSDYLIAKERFIIQPKEDDKTVKKEKTKKNGDNKRASKPKFSYKEQKEFETIYFDIEDLEKNIEEIDKKMNENSSNYGLLNELLAEKEELEEKLLYKYERLEYLEELNRRIEEYKNDNL
ncbi:ABC-F family ATP-binding cassette domain-containing protein [Caproiciproducens sp. MSJ-32]|uniref:ABC-F family ATP-binding cassette domain-containing protein n=1 Tax=Caproiciproducens sp. MSJ-32 TaxID=2841527 RepID=UPI001C10C070|nr:ABC-F family ATP-binding cassette domain-containing protein [Caproiciproducens sp. MSJ-32]MBU5455874.1 ABC-F family ATP-binding cassette domain-containing protein [Caproiciproducens sp. MSJ-32]